MGRMLTPPTLAKRSPCSTGQIVGVDAVAHAEHALSLLRKPAAMRLATEAA